MQRAIEKEMGAFNQLDTASAIWEEIELSESYLVCSMFEEAASLASSLLKRLLNNDGESKIEEDSLMYDMLESTGMVMVQSLKELGRTSKILNQLRLYFVSVTAIPAQVLVIGACLQIAEGSTVGVPEFLEEFLGGWSLMNEQYYTVVPQADLDSENKCGAHITLGVDKYLEVVEIYAISLLARILNDIDLAISWVEKASLPEEKRQGLLRRLHSLHSLKVTNLSQNSFSQLPAYNHESSLDELNLYEGSPEALETKEHNTKPMVLKMSERIEPCSWCFRAITLKFGNVRFVISSRKILLGCLILLVCYVFRKKQATIKRIARRQVISLKKALTDLWQLAFSYQVNPLAAVQPLSAATHGGR
ncbi:putative 3-phosphoinositide-dependent kinase [Quillaja saponaria]|uniref:3-phosphoinositide-dependent kinase n=1 Tax=Quillaja saponaria TaxID=32244 RepID=A0AAD7Q2M2_QUISA|nr:putative 3-phosphoinositide-dependent kinase [Quillaja saponaria]